MDNIADKLGIYELVGVLFPGIFFITTLIFIDFPLINQGTYPDSETLRVVFFILLSYICGIILQEIASLIDTKIGWRKSARRDYLKDNFFNKIEAQKIQEVINAYYNNQNLNADQYEDFFFVCKTYLENKNKMAKADKLDSLYAMSRNLIVCSLFIFIFTIPTIFINKQCVICFVVFIFTILSIFLFYHRAKRYSKMRTRTILRQYINLLDMDDEICDSRETHYE